MLKLRKTNGIVMPFECIIELSALLGLKYNKLSEECILNYILVIIV